MLRLLEVVFRRFQSIVKGGEEIATMNARNDPPEPEMKKRLEPKFCSKCASALQVTAIRPGLWGEERDYKCSRCDHTLTLTVQFAD
jgi:hypothetical protein